MTHLFCDPPCIDPEDIVDGIDVRLILGISTRATLLARRALPDFPRPIRRTGSGVELWDRRDIESWQRDQETQAER